MGRKTLFISTTFRVIITYFNKFVTHRRSFLPFRRRLAIFFHDQVNLRQKLCVFSYLIAYRIQKNAAYREFYEFGLYFVENAFYFELFGWNAFQIFSASLFSFPRLSVYRCESYKLRINFGSVWNEHHSGTNCVK